MRSWVAMADDKKIIIDEDWKSQVETEREATRHRAATTAASSEPLAPGSAGGSQRRLRHPQPIRPMPLCRHPRSRFYSPRWPRKR